MNTSTAYAAGATGQGVTVAVIDSGLDTAHPEFSGRVSSASRDITSNIGASGNRGVADVDGHGTAVAGIVAAAKDGRAMHGVAFESTILGIRADTPGSCEEDGGEGCTFSDANTARAIRHAYSNGAAVINLSLGREPGGSDRFTQTFAAMAEAAERGVFIVISAGNREDADTPPSNSPGFPANFANDARAQGFAVAVGSVDSNSAISVFSNRAQGSERVFLVAPGDRVVTTFPDDRYVTASGTSFAAPHVSGALALLIQAFPNLSGNDALSILFDTAIDLGATGPDAIYGMGLIDLAAAFQPVGASSVAMGGATGQSVPVGALALAPSGASGDWLWESGFVDGAVLRDGYDRAFRFDPAPSDVRGDGGLGALQTAARAGLARQSVTHAGPASVHMRVTPERTRALRNMPEEVYQDRPDVSFRFTHGAATIEAGRGFAAPGPLPGAGVAVLSETRFSGAVANLTGSRDWATVRYRFGDAAVSFRTAESDLGGVSAAAASWDFGRHQIALEVGEGREDFAALGGRIAGRFGMEDASRNSFAAALWSGELGLGWRGAARFEQARADIALPAWMGVEDQVAATAWS
ncbi:S8 family serine peptidase, partial [Glycocaulis profundi]